MLLWAEQLESTEDTESDLMKRPPGWKKLRLGCSAVVELTPGNQAVVLKPYQLLDFLKSFRCTSERDLSRTLYKLS